MCLRAQLASSTFWAEPAPPFVSNHRPSHQSKPPAMSETTPATSSEWTPSSWRTKEVAQVSHPLSSSSSVVVSVLAHLRPSPSASATAAYQDVVYPDQAHLDKSVQAAISSQLQPILTFARLILCSGCSPSSDICLLSSPRPRSSASERTSRASQRGRAFSSRVGTALSSSSTAPWSVGCLSLVYAGVAARRIPRELKLTSTFFSLRAAPLVSPLQDPIQHKLSLILLMSLIIVWGGRLPVVRIARIAGESE